jgi:hypothetical protein
VTWALMRRKSPHGCWRERRGGTSMSEDEEEVMHSP